MKGLSVVELEHLGEVVGASIQKQCNEQLQGADLKKAVEAGVREVLKQTVNRVAPFTKPMDPVDFVKIQDVLDNPAGENELHKRMQTFNDDLYLLSAIAKNEDGSPTQLEYLTSYKKWEREWSELSKALNTLTAGSGLEWVPTGFSNQMIEFVEIEAKVATLFQSFVMPTNPYTFPLLLGDGEAYLGSEAKDSNPSMFRTSQPTTDDLTFTAIKLIANYPASDELNEDSAVPVLPILRKSIARAIAKADDNSTINGDTSATHFDTGYTVASYDARRAWPGLRYLCQSALKLDWSSWSTTAGLALMRAMYSKMGIYALDPSQLVWLLNINMVNKIRSLAEVSTDDKFGSAATVHNGILTMIDGVKIVPTQHLMENVNATGIYDAAVTSKTQSLCVNTTGFMRGIRRGITVEYVRRPEKGINYLVATTRRIWKPVYDQTVETMIGWGYNLAK